MTIVLYTLALTVGFALGSILTAFAFSLTSRVSSHASMRRLKKAEAREDMVTKEVAQVGKVIP